MDLLTTSEGEWCDHPYFRAGDMQAHRLLGGLSQVTWLQPWFLSPRALTLSSVLSCEMTEAQVTSDGGWTPGPLLGAGSSSTPLVAFGCGLPSESKQLLRPGLFPGPTQVNSTTHLPRWLQIYKSSKNRTEQAPCTLYPASTKGDIYNYNTISNPGNTLAWYACLGLCHLVTCVDLCNSHCNLDIELFLQHWDCP